MSALTELNHQQISNVLQPYGLALDTFKLLSGGSENTNYCVSTSSGDFVLTICEQKSIQSCNHLAQLLDFLQASNFASSQCIKTTAGEAISLWQQKAVILKSYLAGSIVKDIPNDLLTLLGQQLAHLHSLAAPSYLPKNVSYGKEKFSQVSEYAAGSDFEHWLKMIANKVSQIDLDKLPKALIHSDIFYNNIIIDEAQQRATIMDFEEASYYYRVFDIGMIIIGTCFTGNQLCLSKARALLAGYQSKISLHSIEVQSLQVFTAYAAAGTAYWRHMNYNFLNFDQAMTEHYKAMQDFADQALAFAPNEFIEQLGISQ